MSDSKFKSTAFKIQYAWFLLILALWCLWVYSLPLGPDYTAGEMRDIYLGWLETGTLYPALDHIPYRILNYPPLFFYLVFFLSKMGISYFLAGRVLSTSFAFLGFFVFYRWLRDEKIPSLPAKFVTALLVTSFPVLYNIPQFYLQWPAVFFSFLGMYLLYKPSPTRIFWGAVACSLACFFKQTQIMTALLGFMWLLAYFRSKAWIYLVTGLLLGGLGLFLLEFEFGKLVWKHLFTYTVGTFSLSQLFKGLLHYLMPWCIFFILGIRRIFQAKEKRNSLPLWYFVGSSLWLLSCARLGASSQYFLEWSLSTLLWIGPEILDLLSSLKGIWWKNFLLIQILIADLIIPDILAYHLLYLQKIKPQLARLCKEMSSSSSPILSELPGLIRSCGKIPALHPFIMHNLAQKKLWDETLLIENLRQKKFEFLILPFDPSLLKVGEEKERWSYMVLESMKENYRVENEILEWKILVPRKITPEGEASPLPISSPSSSKASP